MGNRFFHVFCDHGTSGNGCCCRQWNSEYFQKSCCMLLPRTWKCRQFQDKCADASQRNNDTPQSYRITQHSKFGVSACCEDSVTLWCIIVPLGCICAFILKLPVMIVYFVLNLDEIIKLPVVYKHYKKYKWIKNLT